jgi:Uma2 family endonuclease
MPAALKIPPTMTVEEFLAWDAPPGQRWQLVDGVPTAMAPASRTHNTIQGELGALIRNHLLATGRPCMVVPNPGVVPRARSDDNFRIPELAVTCTGYDTEEYTLDEPVLLVEILSPSNQAETWTNIWSYLTIPSLREVLVLRSTAISAQLLRRGTDGSWPDRPIAVTAGVLELESIGLSVELTALYRGTRLAMG